MFLRNNDEQITIKVAQGEYLAINIESFLIDRQTAGLSKYSIRFYRMYLHQFVTYCNASSLSLVQQVSSDFLRRYLLAYSENHNPGGVHGLFRTLRAFFRWIMDEEVMPVDWKNPMSKVKPPKIVLEPIEPISIADVKSLIDTCQHGQFTGDRDQAIFLFLLDTGARAQELCSITIEDMDLNTGTVLIRHGKGGKSRMVFIGRKTRRALRSYLRLRPSLSSHSLFVSKNGDGITYNGLRLLLDRRVKLAKLETKPSLHDFRRAFALNMLRNGVDIFALQRLMGHADLQVLRRYLAQNDEDSQLAHVRGGPVDNNL